MQWNTSTAALCLVRGTGVFAVSAWLEPAAMNMQADHWQAAAERNMICERGSHQNSPMQSS